MTTREETVAYCMTFEDVYEDYPFHDENWTVMRCRENKKIFACIYRRMNVIWVNVKADPEWRDFWREAYEVVVPGYHMNKEHWNSIILDGTVPKKDIQQMISESYALVRPKKPGRKRKQHAEGRNSKSCGKDCCSMERLRYT